MKISGSYLSLVQGVSQQVPADRGPGQCTAQVNVVPDPVLGLTRRYGSRLIAEMNLGYSPVVMEAVIADTANFRTFEYTNNGQDYEVLYRAAAAAPGTPRPPLLVFNRTTNTFLSYIRPPSDPITGLLETGGVSAITSVGKYVFMAGHTIVPAQSATDLWMDPVNRTRAVVWIRGGGYARKFTVTAKAGATTWTFTYTTPTSSYPGTLDTSTVPIFAAATPPATNADSEGAYITAMTGTYPARAKLTWAAWNPTALTASKAGVAMTNVWPAVPTLATQFAYNAGAGEVYFAASNIGALDVTLTYTHTSTITNPNYAKQVSDIQNAYNSAVTQWIGTAAAAIAPSAIAEQLRLAAVAVGLTTGVVYGSSLAFDNIDSLTVDDGGDGSLIRGVANEILAADQVSNFHSVGKIVKVKARGSGEAYYLKAIPKNAADVAGTWAEVTWAEAAGTEQKVTSALIYGVADGGNFAVASSPTLLTSLIGGTHPDFIASTAGDLESAPAPYFIGKKISYLGMFQDRLLIGAGSTVRLSKIGDYLNFYRSSILTVPADDPFEMVPKSVDDDELRYSAEYDKDLIVFGRKRQYVIPGRTPLSPTSANMPIMSSHADAADLTPISAGGLLFYVKLDTGSSSVHQIQPSVTGAESPDSFPASSQLDDYLTGAGIELAKHSKPDVVFLRTSGARNSIFSFQYLDSQGGRKQDAWYRWDFDPILGPIVGMMGTSNGLLVFSIREAHGTLWLVVDNVPLLGGLDFTPYLDSQRPWATVATDTGSLRTNDSADWKVAFDRSTEYAYLGRDLPDAQALFDQYPAATGAIAGITQQSYWEPTNPVMRDRNGKSINTGNFTITKFLLSMDNSSGFNTTITYPGGVEQYTFNGRVLGDPNNIVGRIPVTAYQHTAAVGRDTKKFTVRFSALSWLPFTITAVEWVGQFFNRTSRT